MSSDVHYQVRYNLALVSGVGSGYDSRRDVLPGGQGTSKEEKSQLYLQFNLPLEQTSNKIWSNTVSPWICLSVLGETLSRSSSAQRKARVNTGKHSCHQGELRFLVHPNKVKPSPGKDSPGHPSHPRISSLSSES